MRKIDSRRAVVLLAKKLRAECRAHDRDGLYEDWPGRANRIAEYLEKVLDSCKGLPEDLVPRNWEKEMKNT